jgi:acyl carrier protein
MRDETFAAVRKMTATYLKIGEDTIGEESGLADLGLDSLGAIQLVFDIEEEFNVSVPDDRIHGFKTIRDVCDGIELLQQQPS